MIICFVCNEQIHVNMLTNNLCVPFVVNDKWSEKLKAPAGTVLHYHRKTCGPASDKWAAIFGESEIRQTLRRYGPKPKPGPQQRASISAFTRGMYGRASYNVYMDKHLRLSWSFSFGPVEISRESGKELITLTTNQTSRIVSLSKLKQMLEESVVMARKEPKKVAAEPEVDTAADTPEAPAETPKKEAPPKVDPTLKAAAKHVLGRVKYLMYMDVSWEEKVTPVSPLWKLTYDNIQISKESAGSFKVDDGRTVRLFTGEDLLKALPAIVEKRA